MAFTDKELEKCKEQLDKFIEEERPPEEIRDKVDLDYKIDDQDIRIFEIRPHIMNPDEKMNFPIARTTYIRRKDQWKIYWMRGNLNWTHYEPVPYVDSLEKFLQVVINDDLACFWG